MRNAGVSAGTGISEGTRACAVEFESPVIGDRTRKGDTAATGDVNRELPSALNRRGNAHKRTSLGTDR